MLLGSIEPKYESFIKSICSTGNMTSDFWLVIIDLLENVRSASGLNKTAAAGISSLFTIIWFINCNTSVPPALSPAKIILSDLMPVDNIAW